MSAKTFVRAVAVIGLASSGAYGLYQLGVSRGMQMALTSASDGHAEHSAPAQIGAEQPMYWHDPMFPQQKFDKPGKSPFMDMQLVPVYAERGTDAGTVKISPRVEQNLGVRTATVSKGMVATAVEIAGNVAYNERDVAVIQARSDGFVERLHLRAPLDPVRKGQALAELYVPEWVAAQEEYLSAKRIVTQPGAASLGALLDGARQRMRLVGMSDAQIALVEATGQVQARLTLTAPLAGVVTDLDAREGMTVMAGAPLFRINGLDTVWLYAEVPEATAGWLAPGNAVEAHAAAYPGQTFSGTVGALLPEVDLATRTVRARIELANPQQRLKPGMFVTVKIVPAGAEEVLLVPTEAVIQTGKRAVVIVAEGGGAFAPVDVEIGAEAGGQSEIRKGLTAGQQIVISGQFLIDSEASLKATVTRMSEAPAAQATVAERQTHRGEGKIEQIANGEITLSHGPIPSLQWGPMTMGFKLPVDRLPENIVVGDTVVFETQQATDGRYEITAISRTGSVADPGVKSGMKDMSP